MHHIKDTKDIKDDIIHLRSRPTTVLAFKVAARRRSILALLSFGCPTLQLFA